MHDTELEQRLRATLRDEADRLPLRVDVEQLEVAVVARRRTARSNKIGLLAAALGVIAFGLAAAGLNDLLPTGILPGVAPGTSSNPPESPRSSAPRSSPSARPAADGLTPFAPSEGAEVVEQVAPTWSGLGTRHVVDLPDSMTASTTVWVACVDESVTIDPDGVITGLQNITVVADNESHEATCIGEQPFSLTPPLTDQRTAIQIAVPADVSYTVLAERLPVLSALPAMDTELPREVEGSSENPVPDWALPAVTIRTTIGTIDEGFSQEAIFACLGPGTMKVEFRTPGTQPDQPANSLHGISCVGVAETLTMAIGARGLLDVIVEADARTAWHVIASSTGELPLFDPPTMRATSWRGEAEVDGQGSVGFEGCGSRYITRKQERTHDCEPEGWPDIADQPPVIARPASQLRFHLTEAWAIDGAVVRAAPMLQTGVADPPVDVSDLASLIEANVLLVPVDIPVGDWVIRVDVRATKDDNRYEASLYFRVNVQP